VNINPGAPPTLLNTGPDDLVFLCMCAPGDEHEDTVLIE
jgi:mannose-6-phosphate isomerase-like protein (cupin superfamily)